jgi:hypothetical protein
MTTYEVRNAQDEPLVALETDRAVVAQHDRASGQVWIAEADALGRRLRGGRREAVGFDPMADPGLTLVRLASTGKVAKRDDLAIQGEPDPGTVVMPEPDDETSSAEQ